MERSPAPWKNNAEDHRAEVARRTHLNHGAPERAIPQGRIVSRYRCIVS